MLSWIAVRPGLRGVLRCWAGSVRLFSSAKDADFLQNFTFDDSLNALNNRDAKKPCESRDLEEALARLDRTAQTNAAKLWKDHVVWTPDEDNRLREIVQHHSPQLFKRIKKPKIPEEQSRLRARKGVWVLLAHYFFPGKTGRQVASRWNRSINPAIVKGEFSEEEDATVLRWQREFGNDWRLIAAKMPGRTANQIVHRWQYAISPNVKHGPWTQDEDSFFQRLYEEHKHDPDVFGKISSALPGRSVRSCFQRYRYVSDQRLKKGPWSSEETAKLRSLLEKLGKQWAAIAIELGTRSDKQVLSKVSRMQRAGQLKDFKV